MRAFTFKNDVYPKNTVQKFSKPNNKKVDVVIKRMLNKMPLPTVSLTKSSFIPVDRVKMRNGMMSGKIE